MLQPDCLSPADPQVLSTILESTGEHLRMMAIGPELAGALDLIRSLRGRGIIASLGHTEATHEQSQAGFAAGISHVTHLFNAMASMHHGGLAPGRPGTRTAP